KQERMARTRWFPVAVRLLVLSAVMLMVAPPPHPALAVNDCSDAAYITSFDPRLAGHRCTEVERIPIRWSGGVAHFRVLKTDDATLDATGRAKEWIREAAGRIGSAMDQMGGLTVNDPTVLITNLAYESPSGSLGGAWAATLVNQP